MMEAKTMFQKVMKPSPNQALIIAISSVLLALLAIYFVYADATLYFGAPVIMFAFAFLRNALERVDSPLCNYIPQRASIACCWMVTVACIALWQLISPFAALTLFMAWLFANIWVEFGVIWDFAHRHASTSDD